MKKRTRRKQKTAWPLLLVLLLFIVLVIRAMLQDWVGRLLLLGAFLCITGLWIFLKLYPVMAQNLRFRRLRLDDVDNMPGRTFEHYVAALLAHQGFHVTVTKGSGDLGVDIIAQGNGVSYAVQCKRYTDNIPRTAVSDAVAGKQHYQCMEAMVVTNRYFTSGAVELAKSTRCVLVDRETLARWINDYQANS